MGLTWGLKSSQATHSLPDHDKPLLLRTAAPPATAAAGSSSHPGEVDGAGQESAGTKLAQTQASRV